MKKNLLALSIAAMVGGIAGGANAQAVTDTTGVGGRLVSSAAKFGNLNAAPVLAAGATPVAGVTYAATQLTPTTTGIGHILFVPYFTTQSNESNQSFMSLLNLVNNDQTNGKAVKLRYRGAANSDDLFDITIFLSPGDVWTANVSAGPDGLSFISVDSNKETSCTLPSMDDIKATGGKFKTDRVLNRDPAQTREGYIEILNMADVKPGSALFTATKHALVNGQWKAPCTPAVMDLQAVPLSTDPLSPNEPTTRGYSWPTGGLSANWTLVNTGTKASFSGEAVALRATPSNMIDDSGAANLVFSPQTSDPVAANEVALLTADPLLQSTINAVTGAIDKQAPVRSGSYDFPDMSTPYVTATGPGAAVAQANEVARNLAVRAVQNEYITDPSVNFATDWVFSMPTRRYAVAMNYDAKAMVFSSPASSYFTLENTSLNVNKDRICVDTGKLIAYDREEKSRTSFVISPGELLKFCGETSVLSFNGQPSVLNAKIATQNIPTSFEDGWLQIRTPGLSNRGLPVVGFAVGKAVGADGGNFGGTWMHRTIRGANQPF